MPIITLTTDFGPHDYYLGALKGALISKIPDLQIIDITHQVPAFDVLQAAYVLRNCFQYYPKDTIHYVGISNQVDQPEDLLLARLKDQWVLATDNGLLSLISEEKIKAVYWVGKVSPFWPDQYQLLAKMVSGIIDAPPPGPHAKAVSDYRRSLNMQPIQGPDHIQGVMVHVDHYGNLISNIHESLFEQICGERPFVIQLKPNLSVRQISESLQGCAVGDPFVMINAAGYLTFGIALGNAAELHGLEKGGTIHIQFKR